MLSMPMKRAIVWSALMTAGFGVVQLVAILLRSYTFLLLYRQV